MRMKKLVIFDCDGVLVDSEHLANQALVDCLAELDIAMTVDEAVQRFQGRRLRDCLAEIEQVRNCTLPKGFDKTYRDRTIVYYASKLRSVPGIEDAIKRVPYAKCVASNGPLDQMKTNLMATKLIHHFGENLFSAYAIQKWKPDPDLFLHACTQMGSSPDHCVVVEDSEAGVAAALAAGMRVFAFGHKPAAQARFTAFREMSTLPDLIQQALGNHQD